MRYVTLAIATFLGSASCAPSSAPQGTAKAQEERAFQAGNSYECVFAALTTGSVDTNRPLRDGGKFSELDFGAGKMRVVESYLHYTGDLVGVMYLGVELSSDQAELWLAEPAPETFASHLKPSRSFAAQGGLNQGSVRACVSRHDARHFLPVLAQARANQATSGQEQPLKAADVWQLWQDDNLPPNLQVETYSEADFTRLVRQQWNSVPPLGIIERRRYHYNMLPSLTIVRQFYLDWLNEESKAVGEQSNRSKNVSRNLWSATFQSFRDARHAIEHILAAMIRRDSAAMPSDDPTAPPA